MNSFFLKLRALTSRVVGFFVSGWKPIVAVIGGLLVVGGVAYVLVPPPSAQGALKGHTVEIYRNAQFQIVFSQHMDHSSVENAFHVVPAVEGSFVWKDNMMAFTPKQVLEKGKTYEVTVGETARSIWQKTLGEIFRQSFSVLDYPEVAVTAPTDQSTIMQDQILTVLFDHPIHVLTKDPKAPEMLKIEPPVAGEYHWLGTSGFEFVPKSGWPAATLFTVTVPKGTKTADGGSTVEDKTWSFSTPALAASVLDSGKHHKPKDPVIFEFNYPINPEEIRKGMSITNSAGAMDASGFSFTVDSKQPNQVKVLKNGGFDLGDTYAFTLTKGFTGNVGKRGLPSDMQMRIAMDEKTMKITAVCPDENGKKDVQSGVVVLFNNPVDEKSLKDLVHVTPAIGDLQVQVGGWSEDRRCQIYDDDGRTIAVSGTWNPSTSYTMEINGKILDIYGQALSAPKTVHFATNPYKPSATVSSYSNFGVLASHLPRLYQIRTMNMTHPISVQLCPLSLDEYRSESPPGCSSGITKTFDPTNTANRYKIIDVDLDAINGSPLALGAYEINVTIPDEESTYSQFQRRTVLITDTALTLKRDNAGKAVVWATDMKTGNPVVGLDVDLWYSGQGDGGSSSNRQVGSGKTDKDGLFIVETKMSANGTLSARAQGSGHFGYVTTYWDDGISPWNYGLNVRYAHPPAYHIGYLYTDRLIYRPDQLVHFKGVVRLDTDAVLSLPKQKEADVTIRDAEGNEVSTQTLPLSSYGSFHGDLQLDSSMALGTYTMEARVKNEDAAAPSMTGSFDVREYRRPDFKVDVSSPSGSVTTGDQIDIPIHAEYYHGVALAGAKASVTVTRTKLYFQPLQGEWYSYGTDESMYDCYWYCRAEGQFETVLTQDVVLDGQGNAVVHVPANLTDYKFSATYVVNVTVTDTNQRSVSGNVEFPVHKGLFYMGIRANYDAGWSSSRADFDIASIETDGSPKGNVAATVTLSKRTWANTKKENPDGSTTWEWTPTDAKVGSQPVTTDANGKASVSFTPPGSGEYVAMVETKDSRGNVIAASAERYIYREDYSYTRVSDDHQLQIVQNKASYNVGDTASLAVQTPYKSSKALVTVERDTIRDVRVVTLGADARIVDVPITGTSVPNEYVSVLTAATGDKSIPEFRLGYANLQVNTDQRVLDLSVTPDKTTAKPGDHVTLTVRAATKDGKPADAEVSIAVVDERVVALLGSIDKNILGKFWFPRDIGVSTAQTLTMLVKKIFFATTEGGAGGKGDNGGASTVRGNFQDTAYWNATVETGVDGTATVSFDLPDNLTSWQILAIGATKGTVVGSAESKIVTRRDLMVEPLMPRILRYNDTAEVGATAFNATDHAISASVTMEAQGVQVVDGASKTVSLAPNTRIPLTWKVTVPKGGTTATFKVTATGAGLSDAFSMSIPVLPYTVPEMVTASGILEKNATEQLEMPEDTIPAQSSVKVSVQPNIGNGLQGGMDYLVTYPYGCAEQRTSAMLGNIVYGALTKLKITKADDAKVAAAKKNVEDAIKLLVPMQRGDGGFGFWSDSEQSYPYLTAYVTWGLTQAEHAGFTVDQNLMDRADAYLRNYLQYHPESQTSQLWDNERAQVLFMLSERNPDGLSGYADAVYERRDGLSSFGRAFLAMAYANIQKNATSAKATRLMNDLQNAFVYLNPSTAYVKEDGGYDYFMSSDIRSTAVALMAVLRLDPKSENVERLVRYLVQNRADGYWATTQNTAMSLLALSQYVEAHPIDDRASSVQVYLDNAMKTSLDFPKGDVSGEATTVFSGTDLMSKASIHQIGLEKDSDTRWFYDITMKTTRDIADIQPFDNGFTVTSEIYALDDTKNEHPLSEATQGENVRVRLKLLVPKRHRYVALESHLPAGLEAVDFTLKTSPKQLAGATEQCAPTYWGGQRCLSDWEYGWWWENVWKHIEQRDDRVFLFSEDLEPGVYEYEYLATAVTRGTFRVPPARVYEFYNPLANAHNEGKVFVVR